MGIMKKIILFVILLFCNGFSFAQSDKEFWFAAPDLTPSNGDQPILLRLATQALGSTITISQPANSAFAPIVRTLGPNATISVDLTGFKSMLESGNPNPDVVENKGLYITSSENISAYYEVLGTKDGTINSTPQNGDIFILKGRNAIGTQFYTPFQNLLNNSYSGTPFNLNGWSSFDIVATADNTTITITPTQNVQGQGGQHVAGIPYKIVLNKGQTYSGKCASQLGPLHLSGTLIVSDKPIAVTIKDDSLFQGTGYDLAGDQLVPVNVVGTDYIVVKGSLNAPDANSGDRVIICATQNNTTVKIGGIVKATLNAGQTYNYQVTKSSEYILTSFPSYVFHLSGIGDEVGGALLPPILCTGSSQVSVTRGGFRQLMFLDLLVRTGGEKNFTLGNATTGKTIPISDTSFVTVPGTPVSGGWKSAQILIDSITFPSNSVGWVANSTDYFHLGMIMGVATGSSTRYGYFSDFGGLTGGTALGTKTTVCQGATATLNLKDYVGDIQWQQSVDGVSNWNNVISGTGAKTSSYTTSAMNNAGTYYFRAFLTSTTDCVPVASNVVTVTVQASSVSGSVKAASDTICQNTPISLQLLGQNGSIQWQNSPDSISWTPINGALTSTYTSPPLNAKTYFRAMVTNGVCNSVYSSVSKVNISTPSLGGNTIGATICAGTNGQVVVSKYNGNIQWQQSSDGSSLWSDVISGIGANMATYTVPVLNASTYYRAKIKNGSCPMVLSPTALIAVNPTSIGGKTSGDSICSGTSGNLKLFGQTGSIVWQQTADLSTAFSDEISGSGINSPKYASPVLTSSLFYRAKVRSGVCPFAYSDTTMIFVLPSDAGGTAVANKSPICINDSSSIVLQKYIGSIQWQQSPDGSSQWANVTNGSGANAATYQTSKLSGTTYFRALTKSHLCYSNSNIVVVEVNKPSVLGFSVGTPSQICYNSKTKIQVTGSPAGSLQWQQSADTSLSANWQNVTGGSGSDSTTYSTPNLTLKTFYRVLAITGGCNSTSSTVTTINVDHISIAGVIKASQSKVCSGAIADLYETGYTGAIQWQNSIDGKNWNNLNGASNASYSSQALYAPSYYRTIVKNGVCKTDTSFTLKVDVSANTLPGNIIASGTSICAGNATVLVLKGAVGDSVQWQQSKDSINDWTIASEGTIGSAKTYTTPVLSSNLFYRVRVKNGACGFKTTPVLQIQVNPPSKGGNITGDTMSFCGFGKALLSLHGNVGHKIQWLESSDGISHWLPTNPSDSLMNYTTPVLTTTTYFKTIVRSGICENDSSGSIKITIHPKPVGGFATTSPAAICSNQSSLVTLNGHSGSFVWEQTVDTLGKWSVLPGFRTNFQTKNLTATTYFRASVSLVPCPVTKSSIATVKVRGALNINLGKDTLICEGTSIIIAPNGFIHYLWNTGSTAKVLYVNQPGNYNLTAVDTFGCKAFGQIMINECDTLLIPNVFTPNGDLKNDFFTIRGNRPYSKLEIYDRWGLQIYSKENYDNSWNGENSSAGAYYYIYKRGNGGLYRGWVELIK
jgi:gliding motility-associated-like protein